jgi:hypothetical protein
MLTFINIFIKIKIKVALKSCLYLKRFHLKPEGVRQKKIPKEIHWGKP